MTKKINQDKNKDKKVKKQQVKVKIEDGSATDNQIVGKHHKIIEKEKNKVNHKQISQNKQKSKKQTNNEQIEIQQGEQSKKKKTNTKKARMIIRNLVYDINEKHLRKLLSPYGEIRQIHIPRHPDRENSSKGFAFVEFVNKNMCLKAIKQLNKKIYKGRPIILDMALAKDSYVAAKMNTDDPKKEDNQIQEQHMQESENSQINEVKQEQVSEEQDNQQQNDDQQQKTVKKQQQKQVDEEVQQDYGHQIFIRNLPISLTQKQLYKSFRKHGKIEFAKLVMNKQTNTSKGTAFIKFQDPEVVTKLIQYSRSYEMYLLKKIRFFQPDPQINLQVDGMIMKIFPVQSRKNINAKLLSREKEGEKTQVKKKPIKKVKKIQDLIKNDPNDKRKLALALQGLWRADEEMNEKDYEKFKNHQKEKLQKLKNPNHSVSDTRIILKFLSKSITEQDLRNLSINFLQENNLHKSNLTYCKLMLDSSRQKSAGFAFIQFRKHSISQQFLEYISASPEKVMKFPFVIEYAIQDSRALLKIKNRNKKVQPAEKKKPQLNKKKQPRSSKRKIISKSNKRIKETHTKRKIQRN